MGIVDRGATGTNSAHAPAALSLVRYDTCDPQVRTLVEQYIQKLRLPDDALWVTTDRSVYGRWLGRRIPAAYGGAYVFLRRQRVHAVLINLERIDQSKTRAVEVVVAEELIHMRDHLDGDRRRHAKHGHDRIAHRVAHLTGTTLDNVRSALIPVQRRPYRYVYGCPGCGIRVPRKKRGTWSCSRCSPGFDPRYVLRIVDVLSDASGS
jgi:predicted SprT family Zn-dependent metalloprotease